MRLSAASTLRRGDWRAQIVVRAHQWRGGGSLLHLHGPTCAPLSLSGEKLPHKVKAVVDSIGPAILDHSFSWLARGGKLVITGATTGFGTSLPILAVLADQLTVTGTIMGTLDDMKNMMAFIAHSGIAPEIGQILPMEDAREAFQAMWEGKAQGKMVFTR